MTISGNGIEAESEKLNGGILYVVATPIGNLKDITLRALEVLKSVDSIFCEDSRRTLQLLNHYTIRKPLTSVFGHKEKRETSKILELLSSGKSIALVCDAGTPAVSDPGSFIVHAVRDCGLRVESIPGPSSVTAALSISGCGSDGFLFLGFLSRRKSRIGKELREANSFGKAVVFFESPYRVLKSLGIAQEILGKDIFCWIGRELTKKFEETISGSLEHVIQRLQSRKILGEFIVILEKNKVYKNAVIPANAGI